MTMRIELKTLYAGPAGTLQPGSVTDMDDATAEAMIAGGYARLAPEPEPAAAVGETAPQQVEIETASAAPDETAVTPQRRRRRKATPVPNESVGAGLADGNPDTEGTHDTDG